MPWREAGHEVTCVDVQHDRSDHSHALHCWERLEDDVLNFTWHNTIKFDVIFAFPPCTHLSKAGARHWEKKGLAPFIEALQIVKACLDICQTATKFWMMENPSGRLSSCWQKPNYRFDPCDYAGYLSEPGCWEENYAKQTCLWTSDSFVMPLHKPVEQRPGNWTNSFGESKDRANKRSATPRGFAQAVFEANCK
ncbi:MAG: hypothetical protein ACRDHZ_00150 [Ktedonobacteraceae bacterium]